jgi:hypothetical protein
MRTPRALPILIASAGLATCGAGSAAARQSDFPLRPPAATQSQDLRSPAAGDVAPGNAERAAAVPIPSGPAAPTPLVSSAGDEGITAVGYGLLAGGAALALMGAAYLGARFAGHAPRVRAR